MDIFLKLYHNICEIFPCGPGPHFEIEYLLELEKSSYHARFIILQENEILSLRNIWRNWLSTMSMKAIKKIN